MSDQLFYPVYKCECCGKKVKAETYEAVIKVEKKCADCSVESITGGLKRIKNKNEKEFKIRTTDFERGNNGYGYPKQKEGLLGLRKESTKHKRKKPLSDAQKQSIRDADNAKWERIRYAYKAANNLL